MDEVGDALIEDRLAPSTAAAGSGRVDAGEVEREDVGIPWYLSEIYGWAYLTPAFLPVLDSAATVSSILWGNYRRLRDAALAEIAPGDRVLQPACVYGDFTPCLARRIGPDGHLLVSDVAPLQIDNCRQKLGGLANVETALRDAADHAGGGFDVVCCFFLLHEMPDEHRRRTLDSLLCTVRPGGKVVFVDYHRPHRAHPLRPLMSLVFDRLEPFAKGLWRDELWQLAPPTLDLSWRKETFFGALYQKTVACRRE